MSIIRPAIVFTVLFTLLFGAAYPSFVTVVSGAFFKYRSGGSVVTDDVSAIVASEFIGREYKEAKYFWSRPSLSNEKPYNATNAGMLNLALSKADLRELVKNRVVELKKLEPKNNKPIPVDLVTPSASGLEAYISVASANWQLKRVAKARSMDEDKLKLLVKNHTAQRQFGFMGEPRVNTTTLNLELDKMN